MLTPGRIRGVSVPRRTAPRIVSQPAPTADALGFVDAVRRASRARWLSANSSTWDALARIVVGDPMVRANLAPDAWLAALAISNGCRLATADRGFARFDGLDWFDPARR